MSMNAIVRSSSSTRVEGISPAAIRQKRQSGSAIAGGYPQHGHAVRLERLVALLVVALRAGSLVAVAVDLDDQVLFRPVQVDLDAVDLGVHARCGPGPGLQEPVLEIGSGSGASGGMRL